MKLLVPRTYLHFSGKESHGDLDDYLEKLPEELMTESERKNSGSYYTPRDITDYITKHTISPWIVKQANRFLVENGYTDSVLVNINDLFKVNPAITKIVMEKYVSRITVCDNACGSGVFLLAAGNALFYLWRKALSQFGEPIDDSEIKSRIVTHNLYGVDINPQAVEIARLRLRLWIDGSSQKMKEAQRSVFEDNIRVGNSLHGYINKKDKNEDQQAFKGKKRGEAFHWFKEFPNIFIKEQSGFDILLGNPPFGSIKGDQNNFLESYQVSGCGDICGYFLERELDLLKEDGLIGNVLAGSLAVNRSMTSVRDLMRASGSFSLAYFGTRPSRLFPDNEERVVLVIGEKGTSAPIQTSTNHRFTSDQRDSLFERITYESTEGLLLGDRIGSRSKNRQTRLPKIGHKMKRKILIRLRDYSDKFRIFGDILCPGSHTLEYRQSAGYYIHALREFPYHSTKIRQLSFFTAEKRDFGLLILNSSLYYLFWTTYGNNRDLTKSLISPFPVPNDKTLMKFKQRIIKLANTVNDNQLAVFNPNKGRVGEFKTSKCRYILDRVDVFLAKVYGLSDTELSYVLNYDRHIRS